MVKGDFFNLYLGNSDSKFEGFDSENGSIYDVEFSNDLCNEMKMFDCIWTKVNLNT